MLKSLFQFFADIVRALNPTLNDDPRVQYNWRQAVFYCLLIVISFNTFGALKDNGYIPGFSAKALASDIDELNKRVDRFASKDDVKGLNVQIEALRNSIFITNVQAADSAVVEQQTILCRAVNTSNSMAANFASNQFQIALAHYRTLTGHDYFHIPTCRELGINAKIETTGDYQ